MNNDCLTVSPTLLELAAIALETSRSADTEAGMNDLRAFLAMMARKARETGVGVHVRLDAVLI